MVLVSQAPLKSKPSFVSVFFYLPSSVELSVVLSIPALRPSQFCPCVLLGPFPRRAGPTVPLEGWLGSNWGPIPVAPEVGEQTLSLLPRVCLLPKHCLWLEFIPSLYGAFLKQSLAEGVLFLGGGGPHPVIDQVPVATWWVILASLAAAI